MFKNQSYKSYKENLDFVRSCSNWNELDRLSKNINHKFLSNSKYKNRLSIVEKKMNTILCDDSWMGHCAKYQLHSGGKRFRALLALIAADIFKINHESAIYAAICCEFIHNASLIHDDLQDRDLLRRGLPTIWNRFGDHTAINLGDYFIAGSFEALSKINGNPENKCKAMEHLSYTIQQTVIGYGVTVEMPDGRKVNVTRNYEPQLGEMITVNIRVW